MTAVAGDGREVDLVNVAAQQGAVDGDPVTLTPTDRGLLAQVLGRHEGRLDTAVHQNGLDGGALTDAQGAPHVTLDHCDGPGVVRVAHLDLSFVVEL